MPGKMNVVERTKLEFEYVIEIPRDPNGKFRATISLLAGNRENQASREL